MGWGGCTKQRTGEWAGQSPRPKHESNHLRRNIKHGPAGPVPHFAAAPNRTMWDTQETQKGSSWGSAGTSLKTPLRVKNANFLTLGSIMRLFQLFSGHCLWIHQMTFSRLFLSGFCSRTAWILETPVNYSSSRIISPTDLSADCKALFRPTVLPGPVTF